MARQLWLLLKALNLNHIGRRVIELSQILWSIAGIDRNTWIVPLGLLTSKGIGYICSFCPTF